MKHLSLESRSYVSMAFITKTWSSLLLLILITHLNVIESFHVHLPSIRHDLVHIHPTPLRPRPPATVSSNIFSNKEKTNFARLHSKKDISSNSDESTSSSFSFLSGNAILNLAIPALVALAIDPLMTLADTAFIGRYSPSTALAGVGSASALLTFAFYLFNFLSVSTTPLVSTKRASGDLEGALRMGGQSLSLAIGLGTLLSISLYTCAPQLLSIIMGNPSTMTLDQLDAYQYAQSFLVIRALAAPAVLVCNSSIGILRGFLDTRTPLVVLLGANVVNFSLDFILIAGLGMGPMGAAIATTTAEWLSAFFFLGILSGNFPSRWNFSSPNEMETNSVDIFNTRDTITTTITPALSIPPWDEIRPLVYASSSAFFRSAAIQITLSGAASMAARGGIADLTGTIATTTSTLSSTSTIINNGAIAAAAHQIAIQLWLLTSFVCDALAAASQTLIADALGRNNTDDVRQLSQEVFTYAIVLGLGLASLLAIGTYSGDHPFLLSFFTSDPTIQEALIPILGWVIVSQPLNSLVFTADGILQGAAEFAFQAKSVIFSALIAILSFWGLEQFVLGDGTMDITTGKILSLIHVWEALFVLIFMRGLTSFLKIIDKNGPIDILNKNNPLLEN